MNRKMTRVIAVSTTAAMALFLSNATIAGPKNEKRLVGSQSEALLLVGPASTANGQFLEMMGQVVILESSDTRNSVQRCLVAGGVARPIRRHRT